MHELESKGVVRRIIEEDGVLLISFLKHPAYFRVPQSPNMLALKERIFKAQQDKGEISFTFDKNLNILTVADNPS